MELKFDAPDSDLHDEFKRDAKLNDQIAAVSTDYDNNVKKSHQLYADFLAQHPE